ncbi:hypothetical protein NGM10_12955 [Halorussus salilacus]|uniref:hypothetical protein n=1 Tax=Halorussus salilacus TaxID=2953750 RepID=UPI0020A0F3CD|nr:hypothetical protein [Halorussus salilacus]USZ67632.1 hypothetical protein NGM10_12955 [Halorussus salilacus]
MIEVTSDSDGRPEPTSEPDESDPYLDAADRLERAIDTQISIINGIDNKAEHITRLVGILVGLVFSVLSLVSNLDGIEISTTTVPTEIAFTLGILSLLVAMGAAIVTYLSSRFRVGLDYTVGYYLSESDETDFRTHVQRVLGSYGEIIEENKRVIEVNSRRFRRTLYFLLVGVLFLSTAGILHLGDFTKQVDWAGLVGTTLLAVAVAWYILTGKYLTLSRP